MQWQHYLPERIHRLESMAGHAAVSVHTFQDSHNLPDWEAHSLRAIPAGLFKNATNQPQFSDPTKGCVIQNRIFNTSVTAAPYEPVAVKGDVKIQDPLFPGGMNWSGVFGVRVDTAFIERNFVPCANFKGYAGTGSGD